MLRDGVAVMLPQAIGRPLSSTTWERDEAGAARVVDAPPPKHTGRVHVKRIAVRNITTARARAAWVVWDVGAHAWALCRSGDDALRLAAFLVDTGAVCDRARMAKEPGR